MERLTHFTVGVVNGVIDVVVDHAVPSHGSDNRRVSGGLRRNGRNPTTVNRRDRSIAAHSVTVRSASGITYILPDVSTYS